MVKNRNFRAQNEGSFLHHLYNLLPISAPIPLMRVPKRVQNWVKNRDFYGSNLSTMQSSPKNDPILTPKMRGSQASPMQFDAALRIDPTHEVSKKGPKLGQNRDFYGPNVIHDAILTQKWPKNGHFFDPKLGGFLRPRSSWPCRLKGNSSLIFRGRPGQKSVKIGSKMVIFVIKLHNLLLLLYCRKIGVFGGHQNRFCPHFSVLNP